MIFSIQLLTALVLDLLFGDPKWFPHPVKYIGFVCKRSEIILRKPAFPFSLKIKGAILFFINVIVVMVTLWIMFSFFFWINSGTMVVGVVLLYLSIAIGDLLKHSRVVYIAIKVKNLHKARSDVAMLVGRDTGDMTENDICRACIESVSENLVDGITAPIFWAVVFAFLGSLFSINPLIAAVYGAYLYKAVNTMDSMVGYKNLEYMDFGRFAARVDDLFNFLPARISGIFVVFGAAVIGLDFKRSFNVLLKDRLKSSSPNSGHTEAAVAGALNIQIGGTSSYFGVSTAKPFIGEGLANPCGADILKANQLILTAALMFTCFCIIIYNLARLWLL